MLLDKLNTLSIAENIKKVEVEVEVEVESLYFINLFIFILFELYSWQKEEYW
jgi:hypothetical protein